MSGYCPNTGTLENAPIEFWLDRARRRGEKLGAQILCRAKFENFPLNDEEEAEFQRIQAEHPDFVKRTLAEMQRLAELDAMPDEDDEEEDDE